MFTMCSHVLNTVSFLGSTCVQDSSLTPVSGGAVLLKTIPHTFVNVSLYKNVAEDTHGYENL